MRRHFTSLLAALAIAFVADTSFAAATMVVPGLQSISDGLTSSNRPFNSSAAGTRMQQVYNAADLGPMVGHTIDEIRFRLDGLTMASTFGPTVFENTTIALSITPKTAIDGVSANPLTANFADNIGSGQQIVFDGDLTLSSSAPIDLLNVALGRPFDVIIPVIGGYKYNGGNLLLDIRVQGTGSPNTAISNLDASNVGLDGISSVRSNDSSATTGQVNSFGLVTQFVFLPEPGTVAVLVLGGIVAIARRR